MKGSMDRVHKGGPWTWGPCFVYVRESVKEIHFLVKFLKASDIDAEENSGRGLPLAPGCEIINS